MLTDICVNLLNSQFREDTHELLSRAADHGVSRILITATDLKSSQAAQTWCTPGLRYCTAGIHPHDAKALPDDWQRRLEALATQNCVRAVGETGLDFNRNFTPREQQLGVFEHQISLAQSINKPLFVHDRESDGEVLACLMHAASRAPLPAVVIHCFTGTEAELMNYLEAGFYIGITGWIADVKRGAELRRLVRKIPLERLLLETDAPFLRPHNAPATFWEEHGIMHFKRRCEPALLRYVLSTIADEREESPDVIAHATTTNAVRLFGFTALSDEPQMPPRLQH